MTEVLQYGFSTDTPRDEVNDNGDVLPIDRPDGAPEDATSDVWEYAEADEEYPDSTQSLGRQAVSIAKLADMLERYDENEADKLGNELIKRVRTGEEEPRHLSMQPRRIQKARRVSPKVYVGPQYGEDALPVVDQLLSEEQALLNRHHLSIINDQLGQRRTTKINERARTTGQNEAALQRAYSERRQRENPAR